MPFTEKKKENIKFCFDSGMLYFLKKLYIMGLLSYLLDIDGRFADSLGMY